MPMLARKHKKQESIEQIKFVVLWKQKKQERIEQIRFVVFWKQKSWKALIK